MKTDPYIAAAFLKAMEAKDWVADGTHPIVTIARQAGADGEAVATRTAEILTAMTHGKQPWLVVDKEIAERVIADHHLPDRIKRFLTEEQTMSIEEHLSGFLGITVPGATMIQKMTETVVHLASIGHVILVGRAAHIVTAKYPRAVHVRVVGSFERRVKRVMENLLCTREMAATEVRKIDDRRRHFLSTYFHTDPEDTERYDMIFNTDRVSVEEAAQLIAHLVSSPNFRDAKAQELQELRHQVLG